VQKVENQAHCVMTIFRFVVGFTKAKPRAIWFCESFNKYVCEFFICIWEYARVWQQWSIGGKFK